MADRQQRQEHPFPEHISRQIRERRWEVIRSGMGPQGYYIQPLSNPIGKAYEDLPIMEPDDFGYIGPKPSYVVHFESACKDGQLSAVQAVVSSKSLEHGADVNQPEEAHYLVPRYAIVGEVMAGAVERVRWLLEHGANPELKGGWGSAVLLVQRSRSTTEEMRKVMEDGLAARRWEKVLEAELAPHGTS